jgi:hypothetical protein
MLDAIIVVVALVAVEPQLLLAVAELGSAVRDAVRRAAAASLHPVVKRYMEWQGWRSPA